MAIAPLDFKFSQWRVRPSSAQSAPCPRCSVAAPHGMRHPRTQCSAEPARRLHCAVRSWVTLRMCARLRVQGFEPRKSTIGMPRPKKARPPQVGTERSGISSAVAAASSKEEASPSGPMELELGTAESSDKAVDQELLKDAAKLTKTARCSVREATVVVRKAEAALRQEQRRAEERMKRWDAAERRPVYTLRLGIFFGTVSAHYSGVCVSLAVILGVLSLLQHSRSAWCQWFFT